MSDHFSENELHNLLERYENMTLTNPERERLVEIVSSESGKKAVLSSSCPEAVFLAHTREESPETEASWENLSSRLEYKEAKAAFPSGWKNLIAAAAILVTAFLVTMPMLSPPEKKMLVDADKLIDMNYQLKHRRPAEVLPQIRDYMSEDSSLEVDSASGEIRITDHPDNIAELKRTITLIDRQPVELPFTLRVMTPLTAEAQIRQVDSLPVEKVDYSQFNISEKLRFRPIEGRHFRQTLEDRFEINCFIQLNPEATEVRIVSLTLYDLETRNIILRENSILISPGWARTVETGQKDDDGKEVMISISLGQKE